MSFYCIAFEKRKNILNITFDKGDYILIISFEKCIWSEILIMNYVAGKRKRGGNHCLSEVQDKLENHLLFEN